MLATQLYSPTLRETPADAEVVSHQLMLRAGMIRKIGAGVYTYLPLALRTLQKIEQIVREEMAAADAQEILMPIIQPAEIWQTTGRWSVYGEEMFRLQDRHQRDYCLAPTHEELITLLVHMDVTSYKQMPLTLFQIQNKYRDEVRPRFGLMRGREFIMKDAYSFDTSEEGLDINYRKMYDAYDRIFTRCGLDFRPVAADSGAIGGSETHEFMALAQWGEGAVAYCTQCRYAANVEVAVPHTPVVEVDWSNAAAFAKVETPNCKTIEEVAEFLGQSTERIIKAVVFRAKETLVMAIVPGDAEVNDVAVGNLFGEVDIPMATDEELQAGGLVPGYVSPIGLSPRENLHIVVDPAVMNMEDAVCGGNEAGTHYQHVCPQRDFADVQVAPIRLIRASDCCPECGGKIEIARGIEVGQVFKLGTKYSEALGATFLDSNGKSQPITMGCYGIGVSRTMAAAIEQSHDEHGIIWPLAIAPYQVVIVPANVKDETIRDAAERLYHDLQTAGWEVVLDDRNERAGIKFKDADLIGYPLRITIGKTFLEDGTIEWKLRKTGEVGQLEYQGAVERITEKLHTIR